MSPSSKERRIRITVSYDGTNFHGWQVQPGLVTIQSELQRVFFELSKTPILVQGSGRTDAGVHAIEQVAAFTTTSPIPCENLVRAMNKLLPGAIRVTSAADVSLGFHARFDAVSKLYEYRIFRGEICSPFERPYTHHYPYPLDDGRMIEAAPLLVGTHDFSAFAAYDERYGPEYSKVRTIYSSELIREGVSEAHGAEPGGHVNRGWKTQSSYGRVAKSADWGAAGGGRADVASVRAVPGRSFLQTVTRCLTWCN